MESESTFPVPCDRHESSPYRSIADQPISKTWAAVGALWLGSVATLFALDHGFSGYLKQHQVSGEIRRIFATMEHFGTPYGALLILTTLWVIAPQVRFRLLRTFSAAVAAGLVANVIKLIVTRTRPDAFDFNLPIWASFEGFGGGGMNGSEHQGFPSAHTAFAFGLAVMLGELIPAGQRWFLCLGAMVALQRVTSRSHFPSDVLTGAGVGIITARYYAGTTYIARICDMIEGRMFPRPVENEPPLNAVIRIESESQEADYSHTTQVH